MHCNHCQPPYEFATWKPARVNIDYHVEFDAHYYSAPYELSFKIPHQVLFLDEFPMTGSGKIQKYLLREQAARLCSAVPSEP